MAFNVNKTCTLGTFQMKRHYSQLLLLTNVWRFETPWLNTNREPTVAQMEELKVLVADEDKNTHPHASVSTLRCYN